MNLDLQIEGRYSQRTEDLQHLKQSLVEFELPLDAPSEHSVSIFKTLVITLALFFSLTTILLMEPAMAFIYVTLIVSGCGTMVMGSEKIIRILPEKIWKN